MISRSSTVCPNCGEAKIRSIVYGLPTPEMFKAAERGEVCLGGCLVNPDNPSSRCMACGAEFGGRDRNPENFLDQGPP